MTKANGNPEILKDQSPQREPLLDLVRIIACFVVVLHHSAVSLIFGEEMEATEPFWQNARLSWMWLMKFGSGTPIFFALAGWLVMNTLDKTSGQRIAIGKSFARRMKRILPPYWLALGLTALLLILMEAYGLKGLFSGGYALEFQSPSSLTLSQWIGNLTLSETWRPIISVDESLVFTRVAWSLCYHEQFIAVAVVFALIAGGSWRKAMNIMAIGFLIIQIVMHDIGSLYQYEGSFLDRWFCFATGIMAFEVAYQPAKSLKKRSYLVILMGGFVMGFMIADEEISISALTGIILGLGSVPFRHHVSKGFEQLCKNLSPWTYPVFLAHLPVQTIGIRVLYESGLQGFWQRAFIVIPVTMAMGVTAGLLFGRFVQLLEQTEIPTHWLRGALRATGGLSRVLLRQIWQAVAVEPILLPGWHIFPRQGRDSAFAPYESSRAGRLSDLTPFPSGPQ